MKNLNEASLSEIVRVLGQSSPAQRVAARIVPRRRRLHLYAIEWGREARAIRRTKLLGLFDRAGTGLEQCEVFSVAPFQYWEIDDRFAAEDLLKRNALSGQNRDKLEFVIGSAVNTLFGVGVGSIRKLQKHFYIPCALHEDCLKDHELAVACALAAHERDVKRVARRSA